MKHYGDITKISSYTLPIVDCITGGSPCQDLSVAGKRAGLEGERSGLFMEQVRIVKEMRERDRQNGRTGDMVRPRYIVWENVPGAYSSNKGADFQAVLTEIVRIAEPDAPDVPMPDKGKWAKSGYIYDDMGRWSVAWRTVDAQYWGTPQRRKRIALVGDFGGDTAAEILFERESLSGHTEQSKQERQETAGATGAGARPAGVGIDGYNGAIADVAAALGVNCGMSTGRNGVLEGVSFTLNGTDRHAENHSQDSRYREFGDISETVSAKYGTGGNNQPLVLESNQNNATITQDGVSTTLPASMGMGGGYVPMVVVSAIGLDRASYNQGANAKFDFSIEEEKIGAQTARGPGAVCAIQKTTGALMASGYAKLGTQEALNDMYVNTSSVRRLTPKECERLQGYPDGWTDIGEWTDTKGKLHKESSDSARYKALGNSIAVGYANNGSGFWMWLLKRISAQYTRNATLGSLFDGIGGFPLAWEHYNGKGSAVWASEIEEFCIAVTKRRFGEDK